MTAPDRRALEELSSLVERSQRSSLTLVECRRMVDAVRWVPGYQRTVAQALSRQRSSPGIEGLMSLPPAIPGVIEGIHAAFLEGICRTRQDGTSCRPLLAMDFRRSKARGFHDILARTHTLFGEHLESLDVAGKLHHRFVVDGRRGTLAGKVAALAHDLQYIQQRLGRLASTRLWINGWRFDAHGPIRSPAQAHLLRAWLTWSATQVHTLP